MNPPKNRKSERDYAMNRLFKFATLFATVVSLSLLANDVSANGKVTQKQGTTNITSKLQKQQGTGRALARRLSRANRLSRASSTASRRGVGKPKVAFSINRRSRPSPTTSRPGAGRSTVDCLVTTHRRPTRPNRRGGPAWDTDSEAARSAAARSVVER